MRVTELTPIDDIIENILTHLNTVQIGGCVDVTGFCARINDDYDRRMEPRVRDKMYEFGIAKRCTGSNQPETAVMLTSKGADIYEGGGWKGYLKDIAKQSQIRHGFDSQKKLTELKKSQEQKRLQEEERRLREEEIEINRANSRAAKSSVKATWFAGAIASMAFILAGVQYYESRTQDTQIIELSSKLKALDSLLKVQQQDQRQMNIRLDSLPIHKN